MDHAEFMKLVEGFYTKYPKGRFEIVYDFIYENIKEKHLKRVFDDLIMSFDVKWNTAPGISNIVEIVKKYNETAWQRNDNEKIGIGNDKIIEIENKKVIE